MGGPFKSFCRFVKHNVFIDGPTAKNKKDGIFYTSSESKKKYINEK
jgi:hypothetical protein